MKMLPFLWKIIHKHIFISLFILSYTKLFFYELFLNIPEYFVSLNKKTFFYRETIEHSEGIRIFVFLIFNDLETRTYVEQINICGITF